MSSADSRPPEMSNTSSDHNSDASAAANSNSPALKKPPRRPAKPVAPVEESPKKPTIEAVALKKADALEPTPIVSEPGPKPTESEPTESSVAEPPVDDTPTEPETPQPRLQPIAPPSEPMQYRAIGLLKGRYEPSEETFNRGNIVNHDGTTTCAVLLGRTTSLVKKHLDLEKDHLWVVYPRTIFQDDIGIAVQIVGVWEPETLGDEEDDVLETPADAVQPDYFSIRGEVIKFDERKEEITISIVQKMRTGKQPKRPFKLVINGNISVKTIGYFWDMHVQRQGNQLILTDGSYVGAVPPKKRSKKKPMGGGGGSKRRPPSSKRGGRPSPKPNLVKDDTARVEKSNADAPKVVKVGNSNEVADAAERSEG
ncbi:hypothetical protein [Adonisia turfae]|uniref:Uncharacterized protein n=1 Tax=Adonisia turfae CCMR0081 TaxID=2292702 RepID=A0A6M0RHU5_9CYAN|nr:hypothetical protein [Adonisia turfae]NEZ55443.1 hypothetical protein [Adonisia turfae CCMR0081]